MKILITSMIDIHKSPHSRLHQFMKHLSVNHEITVICINDWWKNKQTDVSLYTKGLNQSFENVNTIYLTNRKISPILQELFAYYKVRKLKWNNKYDVHLNYGSLITGYFISKKIDSTVYDIGDDLPEMIRASPQIPFFLKPFGVMLGSIIMKRNIASAKKILFITPSLEKSYKLPPLKSECIPNGVDTQLFKKSSSTELKSSLSISDEFIIGFVGVLREWVDLEPVFESLQQLTQHLKVKMLIAGEEGQLEKNKELARKYNIYERVIFTGTVPYLDVPKYVSCMDICLIPFKNDLVSKNSLPLKLFEYMACEKPVISSKLPGVMNAVGEKVFYAATASEFTEKILYLYNNEQVRQTMGIEGKEFVEKYYDWSTICSKVEEILEGVST